MSEPPTHLQPKESHAHYLLSARLMADVVGLGRTLDLAGGPVKLFFDVNKLATIEQHFGSLKAVDQALDAMPSTACRFLLSVNLGTSLDEAGSLLTGTPLFTMKRVIIEALSDALAGSTSPREEADPTMALTPGPTS